MAANDKKAGSSLFDWLPGAKDIEALEGIERDLRNRKRNGNRLSLLLAGLGVVYQLLLQLQGKDLDGLGRLFVGVLPAGARSVLGQHAGAVGLALLIAAALVFVGVRFTSLLLALSREPFRYSYSVGAFAALPNERVTLEGKDRLVLLPLDLTERIDNRIDRLSLLRATPSAGSSFAGSQSHIAISGDVALREDLDGQWELFAMPRVRIGDVTAPETLSFTVRFPLTGALGAKGELAFSARQYRQFCERIYASVALAIYERITAVSGRCDEPGEARVPGARVLRDRGGHLARARNVR